MADYKLQDGGVLYEPTQTFIPEDANSTYWKRYLAWVAAGGVADPIPTFTVVDARARAIATLDLQARALIEAQIPSATVDAWLDREYVEEAQAAIDAGSAPGGTYKLLDALVPERGVDAMAVATALAAERTARVTAVAAIEEERSRVRKAVADASTVGEVTTAMESLTWPS